MTFGIHIVWTTYGTWLPGDDRGHWSPLFDLYGHLIARGHQLNIPDKTTQSCASALMKEPPKWLNNEEVLITADVISKILGGIPVGRFTPGKPGAICTPYALAIESNHVHLLIGPLSEKLEPTLGRLKGVSSSLIGELPHNAGRSRTWTAGVWPVFLYDREALHAVYSYIIDHNLRAGRPAHPFPFTRPL